MKEVDNKYVDNKKVFHVSRYLFFNKIIKLRL